MSKDSKGFDKTEIGHLKISASQNSVKHSHLPQVRFSRNAQLLNHLNPS